MPKHSHILKTGNKNNAWKAPNYAICYQYQEENTLAGTGGIETAGGSQAHNNL